MINIVRIAKVVALLAFVLPWVAVSCSGVDLATSSGVELIQGKMTANADASKQMAAQMGGLGGGMGNVTIHDTPSSAETPDLGMNYFAAGAAAVIVLGLVLTFIGGIKTAGRNALVTSLLAAGLAFGATWQFKEQIRAESMKDQQASAADNPFGGGMGGMGGMAGMGGMGGDMIDSMVQYRIGFWLVLGALVVAAGAGGVAMSGGANASARPDSM
ncbi:MAG: hypothetical protein R3C46_09510 [Hyphomonadaceae bacterium]